MAQNVEPFHPKSLPCNTTRKGEELNQCSSNMKSVLNERNFVVSQGGLSTLDCGGVDEVIVMCEGER